MRWGRAVAACLLCLGACLLAVTFRLKAQRLRARIFEVHKRSLYLEAEQARLGMEILRRSRRAALEAALLRRFAADRE